VPPDLSPWTCRDRAQDPRFVALLALAAASALLAGTIVGEDTGRHLVIGVVLVVAVVGAIGLLVLPAWRDQSHSPKAGALILSVGAVVVAGVAVVIR
jgi:hypothetical protein